jgi:hypothetical protein
MKILFIMGHPAAVRSYGTVLRLLDERGHKVHIAFRAIKTGDSHRVVWKLAEECDGLTFGKLPGRGSPGWVRGKHGWEQLAEQIRFSADYVRYLEPAYADADGLRARAERRAQPSVRSLARMLRPLGQPGVRALRKGLELEESCLVPPAFVERFVADQEPDVVLVSHLAELGSNQAEYVRAAKRLGIHTAYPVFSWDNLTNKGVVHELPELVLVWNDLQVDEAVEMHGIPRERVQVTGASAWDHWFDWKPTASRADFCHEVGLLEDKPIVLYVCSSRFIAPDEVSFVRRWVAAVRARGGLLADAGVIVRPHPRNSRQWSDVTFDDPQVTVWPRFGEEPLDEASRRNYFDSIYHCGAVVGINTSAQIESAIVGRPVLTVLADEFRDSQVGTLHFHYLQADEFGHLLVGRTMDEHVAQLEEALRTGGDLERNERFLRRFVRPLGLDVAGSPLVVEAVEELAARPAPKPERGPLLASLMRTALAPAAAKAGRDAVRERQAKTRTPIQELQRITRDAARDRSGAPVVAGPWEGEETAELLFWIPYLRWAQSVTFGMHERLVTVSRPESAPWYAGIGARHLTVADDLPETPLALPPSLVEERQSELASRPAGDRSLKRLLDFAPLAVPDLPSGLELPGDYVAVDFAWTEQFPESRRNGELAAEAVRLLAEDGAVVVLAPPPELREGLSDPAVRVLPDVDRDTATAVVGGASGFVGSYGTTAYLAVLTGVPAVAFHDGTAPADELRIAGSFLSVRPFGRLHALETDAGASRAVEILHAEAAAARPRTAVG